MFKHRDNVEHAPTFMDPQGQGITSTRLATAAGAPDATTSRKRGRDIRGLDKFRSVIFSESGFPRLHAMVTRNPTLMYPPSGIEEARARLAAYAQQQKELSEEDKLRKEDDGIWAMFEERRRAADDGLDPTDPSRLAELSSEDVALANYHHTQLDAFIRLLYEFNHTTLVKLPIEDTLQLLSRCGREAVAHVVEFEMHARMKREAQLRKLHSLKRERDNLQHRQTLAEEATEAALLAEAEDVQRALERMGEAEWLEALQQSEARWEAPYPAPEPPTQSNNKPGVDQPSASQGVAAAEEEETTF